MTGAIYQCTANGIDFGTGTAAEWSQRLGINKKVVCRYAKTGLKYKGTYQFKNMSWESNWDKMSAKMTIEWAADWDATRERIRYPKKKVRVKLENHWIWKS